MRKEVLRLVLLSLVLLSLVIEGSAISDEKGDEDYNLQVSGIVVKSMPAMPAEGGSLKEPYCLNLIINNTGEKKIKITEIRIKWGKLLTVFYPNKPIAPRETLKESFEIPNEINDWPTIFEAGKGKPMISIYIYNNGNFIGEYIGEYSMKTPVPPEINLQFTRYNSINGDQRKLIEFLIKDEQKIKYRGCDDRGIIISYRGHDFYLKGPEWMNRFTVTTSVGLDACVEAGLEKLKYPTRLEKLEWPWHGFPKINKNDQQATVQFELDAKMNYDDYEQRWIIDYDAFRLLFEDAADTLLEILDEHCQ